MFSASAYTSVYITDIIPTNNKRKLDEIDEFDKFDSPSIFSHNRPPTYHPSGLSLVRQVSSNSYLTEIVHSKIPNPSYDFNLCQCEIYSGKIWNPVITKRGHITYVLTSSSIDSSRCNFVNKCWNNDLKTDDEVWIVMAQRDYSNVEYLEAIGLNDLSQVSSRLHIVVIPNGPKTAGYTRSWCVFLASIHHCSNDIAIWIRDDRRQVVPIVGNRIDSRALETSFKPKLEKLALEANTVYSPRGVMIWKKQNAPRDKVSGKWNQLTQVLCATKQTWNSIQSITCYPQGPILEDYFFSRILNDAGFNCSDMGKKLGIHTPPGLSSSARPGDTCSNYINSLYPNDPECEKLAIQMAFGIAPALEEITWDGEDHIQLSLKIGDSEPWKFSNKPGTQGGGQTHAVAVLYMLQYQKNLISANFKAQ